MRHKRVISIMRSSSELVGVIEFWKNLPRQSVTVIGISPARSLICILRLCVSSSSFSSGAAVFWGLKCFRYDENLAFADDLGLTRSVQ